MNKVLILAEGKEATNFISSITKYHMNVAEFDIIYQNSSDILEEFKVDGIIFHESMTCPYVSNSGYGLPKRLQEKTGIPYLIINGDLNDMRLFSDEQARTSIETFIEHKEEQTIE